MQLYNTYCTKFAGFGFSIHFRTSSNSFVNTLSNDNIWPLSLMNFSIIGVIHSKLLLNHFSGSIGFPYLWRCGPIY